MSDTSKHVHATELSRRAQSSSPTHPLSLPKVQNSRLRKHTSESESKQRRPGKALTMVRIPHPADDSTTNRRGEVVPAMAVDGERVHAARDVELICWRISGWARGLRVKVRWGVARHLRGLRAPSGGTKQRCGWTSRQPSTKPDFPKAQPRKEHQKVYQHRLMILMCAGGTKKGHEGIDGRDRRQAIESETTSKESGRGAQIWYAHPGVSCRGLKKGLHPLYGASSLRIRRAGGVAIEDWKRAHVSYQREEARGERAYLTNKHITLSSHSFFALIKTSTWRHIRIQPSVEKIPRSIHRSPPDVSLSERRAQCLLTSAVSSLGYGGSRGFARRCKRTVCGPRLWARLSGRSAWSVLGTPLFARSPVLALVALGPRDFLEACGGAVLYPSGLHGGEVGFGNFNEEIHRRVRRAAVVHEEDARWIGTGWAFYSKDLLYKSWGSLIADINCF
ncbi:hypothetical protein IMY05_C4842000300 [Salix suchowensis]|nr:hypothetical protein IMY05_C4842000300 [Salix suchowensis]